ncbi:MAG: EAL domain-containing protein, partial [Lachnospiraceae bacterium]|nr:EAL domain-containing protein [Lachnospiraceae bacterium]
GEALARWKHPQKGMISPGDFIPIFEKNGFIRFLDYYIWEETCKIIAAMKRQGYDSYPISINVSRAHFYRNEFQHVLKELVEKYKLKTEDLELEITESIYVEDSDLINTRIQELRDMGFKVAMDDFGSGYSSLNMLKEIPIDIIKLDLKFLDSEENVEKSHKILDALVDLARQLELNVVIEGVETEEQVKFLQGIGEMSAQGYYFSRPLERRKYEELLILDNIT